MRRFTFLPDKKDGPMSYDDIQRDRAIARAMASQIGTPRSIGEGLSSLGKALAARGREKKADRAETALDQKWDQQIAGMDIDPARAAIWGNLPHDQRNSALLGYLDQRDAERRAQARAGASAARAAAEKAEKEQQARLAREGLIAALQPQTTQTVSPNPSIPMSAGMAGEVTTQTQMPDRSAIVSALLANQNVPLDMIGTAMDLMPEPEETYRQVPGSELGLTGEEAAALYNVGPDNKVTRIGGGGTSVTVNNVPEPGLGGNYSQPVTPGQEALDKEYAKTYVEWTQGGDADAVSQISKIGEVANRLENIETTGENLTGPGVGATPDAVNSIFNPAAINARETVEEVVQRNLRALLGAQFTAKEGEQLIARAFNPRLPEAENAARLRRLEAAMKAAAESKRAQAEYFETHGTLTGYQGKKWTLSDFEAAIDSPAPSSPTLPTFNTIQDLADFDLSKATPEEVDAWLDANQRLRK